MNVLYKQPRQKNKNAGIIGINLIGESVCSEIRYYIVCHIKDVARQQGLSVLFSTSAFDTKPNGSNEFLLNDFFHNIYISRYHRPIIHHIKIHIIKFSRETYSIHNEALSDSSCVKVLHQRHVSTSLQLKYILIYLNYLNLDIHISRVP